MTFNPGDKIIVAHDLSDPSTIREHTVVKASTQRGESIVNCGPENIFYTAFCWPLSAKDELLEVIKIRQGLKKAYDDSMTLVYKLRNKLEAK